MADNYTECILITEPGLNLIMLIAIAGYDNVVHDCAVPPLKMLMTDNKSNVVE